ncbi:single hybrid motif-containing protein [Chiua virens]|nr:single hybrid motif-containing protein [Chiua virens]
MRRGLGGSNSYGVKGGSLATKGSRDSPKLDTGRAPNAPQPTQCRFAPPSTSSRGLFPADRTGLHQTTVRRVITNLEMPAMSPTMTEGGITSWKKREGESFSTGEVLLEIETDKATIDVEAQEDGVLGKILAPDGTKNVAVGRVIALLAEEGDDISNLETPKEEFKSAPSKPEPSVAAPASSLLPSSTPESLQAVPTLSHHSTRSKHLMPSVIRLLIEGGVTNAEVIKGTGVRGMLTKGDVLAYLGRASNPLGTYKPPKKETATPTETEPPAKNCVLPSLWMVMLSATWIVLGLAAKSKPTPYGRSFPPKSIKHTHLLSTAPSTPASFDSVIADYIPPAHQATPSSVPVPLNPKDSTMTYFDGLL